MNSIIKKTGRTFGIILALYYLLVNTILFFSDYTLFTNTYFGFVNMAVVLLLGIFCIWITKRRLGGYITFKEGFTSYFLMIIFGFLVNISSQFVLFNFVNAQAKEDTNRIMTELAVSSIDRADIPQEDKDIQLEYLKANINNSFSIKTMFFSFVQSLLGGCIAGLLMALTFRNKSEFTPQPQ